MKKPGDVAAYDAPALRHRNTLHLGTEIRSLAFAPDGQHFAVGTAGDALLVINPRTGRTVSTLVNERLYPASGLAFTTRGELVDRAH